MSDKTNKYLIGLAGEYFVAGMMSIKGWVASLTLKNFPSVDIFGFNPITNEKINVQVKSTKCKKSYNLGMKHSERGYIKNKIKGSFVFVYFEENNHIRYFILSQQEIINLIVLTDDDYFNKPRSKPLADYPITLYLSELLPYENKWDNLWRH
jgi:hypothetical protein